MEKVKLTYTAPKATTVEYNGASIEILPVMSLAQQVVLINNYVAEYFLNKEPGNVSMLKNRFIEAEFTLVNYLYQTMTNIQVENIELEVLSDPALFAKVVSEISNYADFRKRLDSVIAQIKEQIILEKSLGTVIEGLSERAYAILEQYANINPDSVKSVAEQATEMMKQLQNPELPINLTTGK